MTLNRIEEYMLGQSVKDRFENVESQLTESAKKMVETTTNYYVSTIGNDSNSGTTIGTAFATLQKAIDTIASSYLVIQSTIKINISAGTYTQTTTIPTKVRSKERIQIIGTKDGNGIPTVIFEGTGVNGSGIFGLENTFLMVQDIKFQNYRNAGLTGCGIHVQHFANLWTNNVHVLNCDWGISVTGNSRLYVSGGVVDGCRLGIRHYSGCVGTIGYNSGSLALGTVIKNCTQAGVYFQNQSSGHVDYCTINGNLLSGIACVNQSRAHALGCDIKNNGSEGVYIYHQSTWMNDGNIFTNNPKKWRLTAFSTELSTHGDSRSTLQSYINTTQSTHTGTLTNTSIKTGLVIPGGSFVDSGRKLKLVATGTFAGTGTKTVSFRLSPAGLINSFTSASTGGGSWKLEVDFYAVSATSQKHYAVWIEGDSTSATTKTAYLSKSYDFSIDQTVHLYGQLADVAGSIIVETFEIQEVI